MNHIEKLIQQLCPDGVEFKPLGEVASIETGTQLNRSLMTVSGIYPVFNGGIKPSGYHNECNTGANTIAISQGGASAGYVNFVETEFWAGAHCFVVKPVSNKVLNKFLYYVLKNGQSILMNAKVGAGIPGLNRKDLSHFPIPLPPLPVQEAIVEVLDKFSQLEAELEAELEARKQQYAYYREQLLNFEGRTDVEWRTLGEIGKVCMCKRILKSQTTPKGEIPFFKIGTFGKTADAYISKSLFNKYKRSYPFPNKGDVLISASGTIGRTVIYDGEPAYFQDSNIVWIDNDEKLVKNKFLYHYYKIVKWPTEGGTISRLYNNLLESIRVPLPPLSEQEHIVGILDRFDALVNDLVSGLPAELLARRKQYAYYRERLLTFRPR